MSGRHARPSPEMEQLRTGVSLSDDLAPAGVVWSGLPQVTVTVVVDPQEADLVAEGLALVGIPVLERTGNSFTVYRSGAQR